MVKSASGCSTATAGMMPIDTEEGGGGGDARVDTCEGSRVETTSILSSDFQLLSPTLRRLDFRSTGSGKTRKRLALELTLLFPLTSRA